MEQAGHPPPRCRVDRGGRGWRGSRPSTAPPTLPAAWEAEALTSPRGAAALVLLAERTSRFILVRRLDDVPGTPTVGEVVAEMIADLPAPLELAPDLKVYFCDPRSPWYPGTKENAGTLLRDYLPKGTDSPPSPTRPCGRRRTSSMTG